jgi:alkylation response protein AidB-like acyl-CoA dehydrogenase
MALSEKEWKEFKDTRFKYLWDEIGPLANEIERTGRFPREKYWTKFAELGLLKLNIPKEYGGLGVSETQYLEVIKECAKIHSSLRGVIHMQGGTNEIFYVATEEQRRKYWPKLARGEIIGAFGITEPDGGSGRDVKSRARREGSNFILNGRKHFTTDADVADIFIVVCWTESESGDYQINNLLVERGSKGFIIVGNMAPPMGIRGQYHGRLSFIDCVVPVKNIIGGEGEGLKDILHHLNVSRLRIAANALGIMERCLDLSVEYAKQRVTFGKSIAERQAVQRYLAEMAQDIYALQCAIADASKKADEGKDIDLEENLCKTLAVECERRVTDNALLLFGGMGYVREYPIEILYRDARINWIEEGTPTMQYLVSARQVLGGKRTYERFHDEVIENTVQRHIRLTSEQLDKLAKS